MAVFDGLDFAGILDLFTEVALMPIAIGVHAGLGMWRIR